MKNGNDKMMPVSDSAHTGIRPLPARMQSTSTNPGFLSALAQMTGYQ